MRIRSKTRESQCQARYTITETSMVSIFDIKVEKKKTRARRISSLKTVKRREKSIIWVISISFKIKTQRKTKDWRKRIRIIANENQINFQRRNSYRAIGFERIRKIVFPSTSLKRSWLQTKRTPIIPKNSIIPSPKSTITFLSSQMVSFPRAREKTIKIKAKNTII
jgi:hypothetical protein